MFEIISEMLPTVLAPEDQLLLDGAQRVRRGWCQGEISDDRGGVCLLGALLEVSASHSGTLTNAEHKACDKVRNYVGSSIALFNDTPGRTAEEVASAMEAAAMENAHV